MASTRAPTNWTVEQLLENVRQLPLEDLLEFEKRFAAWRAQDGKADARFLGSADEETLLARIEDNSNLPPSEQRRFNRLRHKRRTGVLTETEEKELQAQWRRVEQMNVRRLEALIELARRRGLSVRTLMRRLGLAPNRDVF
jgi:hypothetical protein